MTAFNQTVIISPDVLAQEVSGETVLLDLSGEQYLGLNEVGTRVWQLLQDNNDLKVVFKKLLDEYKVEASDLENDLNRLIADMHEYGIVDIRKINQ